MAKQVISLPKETWKALEAQAAAFGDGVSKQEAVARLLFGERWRQSMHDQGFESGVRKGDTWIPYIEQSIFLGE